MKCEIKLGSRRTEEWTLTSFYCPHCAAKTVWQAEGGDYPAGPELFCATCGGSFYSPESPSLEELEVKERMKEQGQLGKQIIYRSLPMRSLHRGAQTIPDRKRACGSFTATLQGTEEAEGIGSGCAARLPDT